VRPATEFGNVKKVAAPTLQANPFMFQELDAMACTSFQVGPRMSSPTSWDDIPQDVQRDICNRLDLIQLARVSPACKSFAFLFEERFDPAARQAVEAGRAAYGDPMIKGVATLLRPLAPLREIPPQPLFPACRSWL
jgi:hypothetical protein